METYHQFTRWYRGTLLSRHNALIWRWVALLIMLTGIACIIYFLKQLKKDFTVWGDISVDVTKTGAVGDFIAGTVGTVFSVAGFIMVYLTYKDQVRANEKSKVEERFFTLVQIQVNNADQMSYQNPINHG